MSEEVDMKPITPEEGGAVPPKVDPAAASAAPTVKLKPIIRKPMIRKPVIGGAKPVTLKPASGTPPPPAAVPEVAAEAPKPSPISPVQDAMPAKAVLHKTGIIAEGILTPAQAQAAKTKTSRISLESAIGVAPAMKSSAPMKTIKLRRPTDIPPPPGAVKPAPAIVPAAPKPETDAAPAAVQPTSAPVEPAASAEQAAAPQTEKPVTVTQKKTLKLHRPGFKRPTVSGIKRPGAPESANAASPDAAVGASGEVSDLSSVSDIPEIKPLPSAVEAADEEGKTVAGAPAWLNTATAVAGLAALIVIGLCTWTLFREAVGPAAGPNDLATFHSDTDYRR